jgi:hypothetical protein
MKFVLTHEPLNKRYVHHKDGPQTRFQLRGVPSSRDRNKRAALRALCRGR